MEETDDLEQGYLPSVENDFLFYNIIKDLSDTIRTKVLHNPLSTRLEILEAGRIIAACCAIHVPEGLMNKLDLPTKQEANLTIVKKELMEKVFKTDARTRMRTHRYWLRSRIKASEKGDAHIHPVVLKGYKTKLAALDRAFKRSKDQGKARKLKGEKEIDAKLSQMVDNIVGGTAGGSDASRV
jgi:hypothetical protein